MKTFYLYAALVFLTIFISFVIKFIMVVRQSTFDGSHHFTIAVTNHQNVKQIIAFSPQVPSEAILQVKDTRVPYATLGKEYGIAADVQLEVNDAFATDQNVSSLLWDSIRHYASIKTEATIIDLARLMFLSKDIVTSNKVIQDISLTKKIPENNTLIARALNDPSFSSENVSIQIVNATDVSGMGQRLSRVLTNMGANVVDVSTSHVLQKASTIEYFGEKSYTLGELINFLDLPASELHKQPIANIVIILGEDSKGTKKF